MKKYIFIVTCLLLVSKTSTAQHSKIYQKLEKILTSSFVYNGGIIELQHYKNKAYTFGFAISINHLGMADGVVFTNRTKTLDSLVSFDNITNQLKKEKLIFKNYKNTLFVSIALVRRSWDSSIDNFYDSYQRGKDPEKADFDQYFYNVLPNIEGLIGGKKIILLPTFSLVQAKSQR